MRSAWIKNKESFNIGKILSSRMKIIIISLVAGKISHIIIWMEIF
jgi:hypothetical protein